MNRHPIRLAPFFSVIPLLLSATFPAYAGGETQNGGYAVVCENARGGINTVELFDYWEMSQLYGGEKIELGSASLSVEEKVRIAIERYERVDPIRAQEVTNHATIILRQIPQILREKVEGDPGDDHSRLSPKSPCFKRLFAAQIREPGAAKGRYDIRRSYWEKASNDQKAGIILHEAIYRTFLKLGAKDSDGVREINFIFSSQVGRTISLPDYARVMKKIEIPMGQGELFEFSNFPGQYVFGYEDHGEIRNNEEVTLSNDRFEVTLPKNTEIGIDWQTQRLYSATNFHADPPIRGRLKTSGEWVDFVGKFELGPKNFPLEVYLAENTPIRFRDGLILCLNNGNDNRIYTAQFHQNGSLMTCASDDQLRVNSLLGKVEVDLRTYFYLDSNGRLSTYHLAKPQVLRVPGIRTPLSVRSFSVSGDRVWHLTLSEPILLPTEGDITKLEIFNIDWDAQKNSYVSDARATFSYPRLKGGLILPGRGLLVDQSICRAKNLSWYRDGKWEEETKVVIGAEKMFDLGRGQLRDVVDDTVTIVKSIQCGKKVDVN